MGSPLNALRRVSLGSLSSPGRRRQYTQARLYRPGEYAVRRGEVDRSFFIISRGSFEVLVSTDAGPQRVRVLDRG
jgi:CRP-like cAMP-binding protein